MNSPSISTKLKAMYSKKLKREDIEELIRQKNVNDVVILLKSKLDDMEDIPINVTRIEIERALDKIIINDINKIRKYLHGENKKILDVYILKFKLRIYNYVWKELNNGNVENNTSLWIDNLFTDLKGINNVNDKQKFLDYIKHKRIKEIFDKELTVFQRGNTINRVYFELLLSTIKNKRILENIRIYIDLLNILWTYRCNKYYKINTQDIIINSFYKIKQDKLQEIQKVNEINNLKEVLQSTAYKDVIIDNPEKDIKRYMYNRYKRDFNNSLIDVSSVISYFNMLEIERDNMITIIEGIRYGLSIQEIQKKIII